MPIEEYFRVYLCVCLHYAKIYSDIDDVHESHRHTKFDPKNHYSVNKLMVTALKQQYLALHILRRGLRAVILLLIGVCS